jgi:hypothetical protein
MCLHPLSWEKDPNMVISFTVTWFMMCLTSRILQLIPSTEMVTMSTSCRRKKPKSMVGDIHTRGQHCTCTKPHLQVLGNGRTRFRLRLRLFKPTQKRNNLKLCWHCKCTQQLPFARGTSCGRAIDLGQQHASIVPMHSYKFLHKPDNCCYFKASQAYNKNICGVHQKMAFGAPTIW